MQLTYQSKSVNGQEVEGHWGEGLLSDGSISIDLLIYSEQNYEPCEKVQSTVEMLKNDSQQITEQLKKDLSEKFNYTKTAKPHPHDLMKQNVERSIKAMKGGFFMKLLYILGGKIYRQRMKNLRQEMLNQIPERRKEDDDLDLDGYLKKTKDYCIYKSCRE